LERINGLALACLVALATSPARAQDPANLFRGKTIWLVVGASAGGGFDTYSRIIAEH
jgi:tripartite-type tricarboxylate transporter receptor subunit TctC